jgi:hypothetical protein
VEEARVALPWWHSALQLFNGHRRILGQQPQSGGLGTGVKQQVQMVGLDPAHYATHSLRRGGASAALQSCSLCSKGTGVLTAT